MSDDFVTRLELQLRAAAERDVAAGPVGQALRDVRWRIGSPALAGAVAALVVAVVVAIGALALRGERREPVGPRVVAQLDLTGSPEELVSAFDCVWIADPKAREVVRVDPASHRVIARIPVPTRQSFALEPVGGELWVPIEQRGAVFRIDPETNKLLPRLTLHKPGGGRFAADDVLADGRLVWALAFEQALRVDPATGAGLQLVAPAAGVRWFELNDGILWTLGRDGILWTLGRDGILRGVDAEGRTVRKLRSQLPGIEAVLGAGPALLAAAGSTVARIDPANGRVLWRRALGQGPNEATLGNGVVWVHYSPARGGDRLTALALDSGEPVGETALPVFGATGMAMVDREIWIDTPGGKTLVVRP